MGLRARHRQRPCPLHVHKLSVLRPRSHDKEALRHSRRISVAEGKAHQKLQEEKDTQCQDQEQKNREAGQVAQQVGDKRQAV